MQVRSEFVRVCGRLLVNLYESHAEDHQKVTNILKCMFQDKDDSVRLTCVQTVAQVASAHLRAVEKSLMRWLCERAIDKQDAVRESAVIGITKIFSAHVSTQWNSEEWDPTMGTNSFFTQLDTTIMERLSMIPGAVMDFAALNKSDPTTVSTKLSGDNTIISKILCGAVQMTKWNLVVKLFDDFLLFKKTNAMSRAQVLISMHHDLNEKQRQSFGNMLSYRSKLAAALSGIIRVKQQKLKSSSSTAISSTIVAALDQNSKMFQHRQKLTKLLGEDVSDRVYDTLIVNNRDKHVEKSVLVLTSVETPREVGLDHRSRIVQALRRDQQSRSGGSSGSSSGSSSGGSSGGIDEIFLPVLKLATLGTCVSSTEMSISEIMNTCLELAEDDAYEKTMSALSLILTLCTKLSTKYGAQIWIPLMELIVLVTEKGEEDDSVDGNSDSDSDGDGDGSDAIEEEGGITSSQRRQNNRLSTGSSSSSSSSSMSIEERQNIVSKCLEIIASTLIKCHANIASFETSNKHEKSLKVLRQNANRKRLYQLCIAGNNRVLSKNAALAYSGVLMLVGATYTEWLDCVARLRRDAFKDGVAINVSAATSLAIVLERTPIPRRTSTSGGGGSRTDENVDAQCTQIQQQALDSLRDALETETREDTDPSADISVSTVDNDVNQYNFFANSAGRPMERTAASAKLLAKVVRLRFRRHHQSQVDLPSAAEVRRVFDTLCRVVEDEHLSFSNRKECAESLFMLSREKGTFDECGAKPFFAIASMVESDSLSKKDKMTVFTDIHRNIVRYDENPIGPDKICLGMAHAFASVFVLGTNSTMFGQKDSNRVQDMIVSILRYFKMRLVTQEVKIMRDSSLDLSKKHRAIKKLRFRNMCEQMLPYGVGMISKFYRIGSTKDNEYHSKKQHMVKKMLQALSSPEVNGGGVGSRSKNGSCSGFVTSSLNFDLLLHMSKMLRVSHNMADE